MNAARTTNGAHTTLSRILFVALLLGLLAVLSADTAAAQAAAEYAGAISKSGSAGTAAKRIEVPIGQKQPEPGSFLHLPAGTAKAFAEANRRSFEEQAGPDAARLQLRSVPKIAQAWVNRKFVGTTPVDLSVAPGSYTVEMRAVATAPATQKVQVASRETREVSLTLKPRYPSQVQLR